MRRAGIFAFVGAFVGAIVCCLAAAAERDPVQVLRQVTEKVVAGARHTPHYTCVQTVNREYFRPAAATLPRACDVLLEERRHRTLDLVLRPFAADRLRLDVTLDSHGELFSWAGASRFDEAGIDHVVRNGPIATGAFAGFLIAVFETDAKRFRFERRLLVDGRNLMEYSFQVSKSESHYQVRVADSWVQAAYSGTFRADPETKNLVEMTIETGELPPALGQCLATSTMEFGMIGIGDGQFLLPAQMRQRFVLPTGEETENRTEFTNCREYRSESTVTFSGGRPPAQHLHPKAPRKPFLLPGGLPFSFALTAPIRSGTAAAGDPFAGRLLEPLRDERARLLAPIGALVEGHLARVQNFFTSREVVVVLRPESVEINGARVPLTATGSLEGLAMLQPGEEHSAAFVFEGDHPTVPKGFRSVWRTGSQGN